MRCICGLNVGLMFKNGSCQQAGPALCGVRPRRSSPYMAKVFTLSRSLDFSDYRTGASKRPDTRRRRFALPAISCGAMTTREPQKLARQSVFRQQQISSPVALDGVGNAQDNKN